MLDTTITEELREEGHLRELLSKIQNMRKDSGFQVADKINLYVTGNEMLEAVVRKFEEYIKKETLTVDIYYNEEKEYVDCKINGEDFKIYVEVVK